MERIETTILRNLVFNEEYSRKVIPFIQPDYFDQRSDKVIFEEIASFIVKYGSAITTEALSIEIENRTDLNETEVKETRDLTLDLNDSPVDQQWLVDTTEKWCRDRAIYLALMESIGIADGGSKEKVEMLFLVSYLMLSQYRLTIISVMITYSTTKKDMSSTIKRKTRYRLISNTLTRSQKAGPNKTLNIALAGTGVGKSLFMCHMASLRLAPRTERSVHYNGNGRRENC